MKKYQNKITGAIVFVESEIGGDWVLVEEQKAQPIKEAETEKTEKPVKKANKKK